LTKEKNKKILPKKPINGGTPANEKKINIIKKAINIFILLKSESSYK
jgi:hypothetical protein